MTRRARPTADFVREAFSRLKRRFGEVACPLQYKEPYQLCVAVILSAQCTDEQVNRVTPELFRAYPTAAKLAAAPVERLEELVHSTGFYRNKARNIQAFCRSLVEDHGGRVPDDLGVLVKMPGVGRKTANVVLQELYGIASGVVVDTHVARLSGLLGLSGSKDPVRIEKDLMDLVPRDLWIDWSLYMISLGRSSCPARRPKCESCVLEDMCPSARRPPAAR